MKKRLKKYYILMIVLVLFAALVVGRLIQRAMQTDAVFIRVQNTSTI